MYSHDTYGLGHLTRTTRLAQGITKALPGCSVLILSGSPIAHRFAFPPGVDYIKLPSVVKTGPETYLPRELGISKESIRRMRAQLICDAIEEFRPHLLLVDNVPAGMKGELRPVLANLRRRRPETKVHLSLRDVLDDPEVIRTAWQRDDIYGLLREHYDAIHIFGLPGLFDAIEAYDLPADLSEHLGYVGPASHGADGNGGFDSALQHPPAVAGRRRVLVTIGGGGDGIVILESVAGLQARLGPRSPYEFYVVTGPLMDPEARQAAAQRLAGLDGVSVHEFISNLPAWMARSDLVLSMGGYNTLCEILACARRSLVVPRIYPRREQLIRARAFEQQGLVSVIDPRELTVETLAAGLEGAFRRKPSLPAGEHMLGGVTALQKRVRYLLGRCHPVSPGRAGRPRGERRASVGTGRGRYLGPLLLALALFGAPSASTARADLRPARVYAEIDAAYDTNLLNASDAELDAFHRRAPGSFFVVDRMEDGALHVAAEADWPLGRRAGVKPKLRIGYARDQFLHNPITGVSTYSAQIIARVSARTRTELACAYRPQVYGRHRVDKDAAPGDLQFRAEAHRRWDVEWGLERAINGPAGRPANLGLAVEGSWKDYTDPFAERDQRRLGLGLQAEVGLPQRVDFELSGGWRRALSRNEPDLGKDLSYYEWGMEPQITWSGLAPGAELSAILDLAWRHYTSRSPEDRSHYRRHDLAGAAGAALLYRLSNHLAWQVTATHAWRSVRLSSGAAIDYDEEGSFSEWVSAMGLRYEWES